MSQRNAWFVVAALAFLTTPVFAEPSPPQAKVIISAENVEQVRSVEESYKHLALSRSLGTGALAYRVDGNVIEIVDQADFRPLRKIALGAPLNGLAVSQGGRFLAWRVSDSPKYVVQEVATGQNVDVNVGDPKWPANRPSLSPDGKWLALENTHSVATDLEVGYCELDIWDASTGKLARTLAGSKWGALTPVFSPDGKLLALGNRNYETRIFDVATGKLLHTLSRRMTHELAFSPDGKVLAAGYVDGAVALWDVASGELLRSQPSGAKEVYTLDWSPKGDVLATAGTGRQIALWEPQKLTRLRELEASESVIGVRFTADGTRLISSGQSRKIVIWAIPDNADK